MANLTVTVQETVECQREEQWIGLALCSGWPFHREGLAGRASQAPLASERRTAQVGKMAKLNTDRSWNLFHTIKATLAATTPRALFRSFLIHLQPLAA